MKTLSQEIITILHWIKTNMLSFFVVAGVLGSIITATVQVYFMYEDVRSIPAMKNTIDSVKVKQRLSVRVCNNIIDALCHEMDTKDFGNYQIEQTNQGDFWHITTKDGMRLIYPVNYNRKQEKFHFFDFDNKQHWLKSDQNKTK